MTGLARVLGIGWLLWCGGSGRGDEPGPRVPEPLEPWREWVLEEVPDHHSPALYHDATQRIAVWPTSLRVDATESGATWELQVRVFDRGWLPLPGGPGAWPRNVRVNDIAVPVVSRVGVPAIRLGAGKHAVAGEFRWQHLPETLPVPAAVGLVSLSLAGSEVVMPERDPEGPLWLLRRSETEPRENRLAVQVHRVLEDGRPLWLRTQVELSVSGASREEELGCLIPEGWLVAEVQASIPVRVDSAGCVWARVRAGSWPIHLDAFRTSDTRSLAYAPGARPAVAEELVALRSRPDVRSTGFPEAPRVDSRETSIPEAWRGLPVWRWQTATPLVWKVTTIPGDAVRPNRFESRRRLWLADDGRSLTYEDWLLGDCPTISRLDAAPGHHLGSVQVGGQRQLLTRNSETQAEGLEIRTSKPRIRAVGETLWQGNLSATGWRTDVDSLQMEIVLPPGWRMLALWGADEVEGDWLTAWTLLDLFLVLVFTMGVARLHGWRAAGLAFVTLAVSYHEACSPRFTWLFLLVPTALLAVVRSRRVAGWIRAWWLLAVGLLLFTLVPFVAGQLQMALYPQLEPLDGHNRPRSLAETLGGPQWSAVHPHLQEESAWRGSTWQQRTATDTRFHDWPAEDGGDRPDAVSAPPGASAHEPVPGSFTQTSIVRPTWTGNSVTCLWDGPVSSSQSIHPVLLSAGLHRLVTLGRVLLLGALLRVLLRGVRSAGASPAATEAPSGGAPRTSRVAGLGTLVALLAMGSAPARAQVFPDPPLLDQLRHRLLKPDEAFPSAAEIPSARLQLDAERLRLDALIHAVVECAVPIPGRLPDWNPLSVALDGEPAVVTRRPDGYVWVRVPAGIHQLTVTGRIVPRTEWVWSLPLGPRHVEIEAPGWKITGVTPGGQPDRQVFFTRPQPVPPGEPAYDQPDLRGVVEVGRRLALGPVWRVQTTVRRLSPPGQALTLHLPLLPGERVVTPVGRDDQTRVGVLGESDGKVAVTLAADQGEVAWEGELPSGSPVELRSQAGSEWVERWSVVTSSAWQLQTRGLPPVFEPGPELVPVWTPWPGEAVTLEVNRPETIPSARVVIRSLGLGLEPGRRRRTASAAFLLESTLGGEFPIGLPPEAVIESVRINAAHSLVDGEPGRVLVTLRPGSQRVTVEWASDTPLGLRAAFDRLVLPAGVANLSSGMIVPESRWILWVTGPQRGPAVRFWSVLALSVVLAVALSRVPSSPLTNAEWLWLTIGLTQVSFLAGAVVVIWLFGLAWRGRQDPRTFRWYSFDLLQLALVGLTLAALLVLMQVVHRGLLGQPVMFIAGNGSSANHLLWLDSSGSQTEEPPAVYSISIWYYRLLMLLWALWLANAVIRWLGSGWDRFTVGGAWQWWDPHRQTPAAGRPATGHTPA